MIGPISGLTGRVLIAAAGALIFSYADAAVAQMASWSPDTVNLFDNGDGVQYTPTQTYQAGPSDVCCPPNKNGTASCRFVMDNQFQSDGLGNNVKGSGSVTGTVTYTLHGPSQHNVVLHGWCWRVGTLPSRIPETNPQYQDAHIFVDVEISSGNAPK
jgi:hypothetical protein